MIRSPEFVKIKMNVDVSLDCVYSLIFREIFFERRDMRGGWLLSR